MVNPAEASGLAGDTLLTRLNTTGDKRSEVSRYTGTTFVFGMSYQVSDYLIKVLQDYFQATSLTKELNERLGSVNKQVTVLDQFTPDTIGLPQVVVTSMPADSMALSFGNRLGRDTYNDELYDIYGGQITMNSTIEVYDSGKPNVHELADIVFLGLMQYVLMRMQAQQMILDTTRVRFTNANRITGDKVGGEVYRIPIVVPIVSEWRQYMKIETVDAGTIREVGTRPATALK
jgi:hypothetical protein